MIKPETYSTAEASTILGVSTQTLNRQIKEGNVPAIRVGGRIVIPRSYIDQLFSEAGCPREEASVA